MQAPHEALGAPLEHVDEQPGEHNSDRDAHDRGEGERMHTAQPAAASGRTGHKLFAVELVAAQLGWLAVLAFLFWLLLHSIG